MQNCLYYQARIDRANTWFLTSVLKSFNHLVFDRTLDKVQGIFEFFVPADLEDSFLEFIESMQKRGIVSDIKKLPNRLLDAHEKI